MATHALNPDDDGDIEMIDAPDLHPTDDSHPWFDDSPTDNDAAGQEVDEHYWPNIIRYIETGKGPRPLVTCTICCLTKLSIPGLHEETYDDPDEEYEDYHVLPCGHVFGKDCITLWMRQRLVTQAAGIGPRCPVCRMAIYRSEAEANEARREALLRVLADHDQRQRRAQQRQRHRNRHRGGGPAFGASRATLRPAGVPLHLDSDEDDEEWGVDDNDNNSDGSGGSGEFDNSQEDPDEFDDVL